MVIWQLDRLLRSGPLCALATLCLPIALAVLVNSQRTVDEVLGILLVASGIIFLGAVFGSTVTSALGAVLFALGTVVAEIPVGVMFVVSLGLYLVMVIHDLAGAFHRAPRVNRALWSNAARTTGAIAAASAAVFWPTYLVAGLAEWQSIIVPFGIAAIGFGAKLAADSHRAAARQLTAKRVHVPADERPDEAP